MCDLYTLHQHDRNQILYSVYYLHAHPHFHFPSVCTEINTRMNIAATEGHGVTNNQPLGDIMGIHNDMWTETSSTRGSEFPLAGPNQSEYISRYIDLILPTVSVEIANILPTPSFLYYCLLNYL